MDQSPNGHCIAPTGIISRPLSSSPILPPLGDWQAVPFEILNPVLTAPHGGSSASSLNFKRCDHDLMLQTHPSLLTPLNFPMSDLRVPGDTTLLYPLSPESGSDGAGDANTIVDDRHSIHALLSDTERSPSNTASNSPTSHLKHGFWSTVLCQSDQGRTTSGADVLEFVPAPRPAIIPVPPVTGNSQFPPLLHMEETGSAALPERAIPNVETPAADPSFSVSKDRQDRPYECNQCGLRFRKRCNAINHTKIVRTSKV
jgi:hypothetical protein